MPIAQHLLIEFYGCSCFPKHLQSLLRDVAKETNSKPLEFIQHDFKPQGTSAVQLLAESHISIHTYPEYGYAAIDIYTCGKKTKPFNAIHILEEAYKPKYILLNKISRGIDQ